MAKKETLPLAVDLNDMEPGSNITYASDVVAIIAGIAAAEVEGIAGMVNVPSGNLLGKNRGVTKGVKVETGTEEASVDLYVTVEYGKPIQKAAQDAQENVRRAIESMTGLHVVRVDVHVQGVSFEKENDALTAGAKNAVLESGTAEPSEEEAPAGSEAVEEVSAGTEQEAPAAEEDEVVVDNPMM